MSLNCLSFINIDLIAMCKDLPCEKYAEKVLNNSNTKYFALQIASLVRIIIGYKYAGWIMEAQALIKEPFIPNYDMLFLYNDN